MSELRSPTLVFSMVAPHSPTMIVSPSKEPMPDMVERVSAWEE